MRIHLYAPVILLCCAHLSANVAGAPPLPGRILDALTEGRMEVYFFSGRESALCIVDEGDGTPQYGSLRNAMKRNNCTAGVNGGYFGADRARTPLGLVKHKGKCLAPLSTKGFAVSGVLYDTGTEIRLERSNALNHPVSRMQEAVQGGPFLIEHGKPVGGLNNTHAAIRTFVATDGRGNWCIGITPRMTLHRLAQFLSKHTFARDFHIQTALNLDGGTSSAIWDGGRGVYRPSLKSVRNYVGITRRGARTAGK